MNYLLDTCVLCEPARKTPSEAVIRWMNAQEEDIMYISVLSLGEIAKGVAKMPRSKKQIRLEMWLGKDLPARFDGRILDITTEICLKWGEMSAEQETKGYKAPVIDGLLAATAAVHSLTMVTRDITHFRTDYVPVLNPWTENQ